MGILIYKYTESDSDLHYYVGVGGTIIGAVGLLFELIIILSVQIPAQKNYEIRAYEKEVLEYRLENNNEITIGNELLYNDIIEFNSNLKEVKYYYNSSWTNWFHNGKIASIDYIAYKKVKE